MAWDRNTATLAFAALPPSLGILSRRQTSRRDRIAAQLQIHLPRVPSNSLRLLWRAPDARDAREGGACGPTAMDRRVKPDQARGCQSLL